MTFRQRIRAASRAALLHLLISIGIASLVGFLVLAAWFPFPYYHLSGGLKLFLLVVVVDVVCGPILTLVLFNPDKLKPELWRDMSLVLVIQIGALMFGLFTAWQARPIYLVHEVDRFRVISLQDYQGEDVALELANLPGELKPGVFSGPLPVGIRNPADAKERQEVMVDSVMGGRDYSQRPNFYIAYDSSYMAIVMKRARPLTAFLKEFPETEASALKVLSKVGLSTIEVFFLPVVHRQDWVVMLAVDGKILGFLPGDGFTLPK